MSNEIIATLQPGSWVPPGSIFRGKLSKELKIEYKTDAAFPGVGIKEKLVETKTNGDLVFRKPGETTKTSGELKKEGKPPFKENPKPPKQLKD